MNENENLVIEEVTENTEETVEETPQKMFTQDELNDIVGKAKARERAKITKQKDREYGELMETLRTGTGKPNANADEINDTFSKFYEGKGIKIQKNDYNNYSAKDLETLARAEADEIIRGGYEDVVDEVDRLTELGPNRMNAREKALFKVLAEHRASAERNQELAAIGVTEDVYNSSEFKEYADQYKSNVPITKIYEQFIKTTKPQKDYKIMGSMKNTMADNGVKDFYSFEEASKFTKEDFDKNPELYQKVLKSMPKWKI